MLDMGKRDAGIPDAGTSGAGTSDSGTLDAANARMRARRARRLVPALALVAAIVMTAGVLAFLVLVVMPSASAAGGCGGG
jgi:peptidoglycan/LPS O-acetylase OafA/YrhL